MWKWSAQTISRITKFRDDYFNQRELTWKAEAVNENQKLPVLGHCAPVCSTLTSCCGLQEDIFGDVILYIIIWYNCWECFWFFHTLHIHIILLFIDITLTMINLFVKSIISFSDWAFDEFVAIRKKQTINVLIFFIIFWF